MARSVFECRTKPRRQFNGFADHGNGLRPAIETRYRQTSLATDGCIPEFISIHHQIIVAHIRFLKTTSNTQSQNTPLEGRLQVHRIFELFEPPTSFLEMPSFRQKPDDGQFDANTLACILQERS